MNDNVPTMITGRERISELLNAAYVDIDYALAIVRGEYARFVDNHDGRLDLLLSSLESARTRVIVALGKTARINPHYVQGALSDLELVDENVGNVVAIARTHTAVEVLEPDALKTAAANLESALERLDSAQGGA